MRLETVVLLLLSLSFLYVLMPEKFEPITEAIKSFNLSSKNTKNIEEAGSGEITVTFVDEDNTKMDGIFYELYENGNLIYSGYQPKTLLVTENKTYKVKVDYKKSLVRVYPKECYLRETVKIQRRALLEGLEVQLIKGKGEVLGNVVKIHDNDEALLYVSPIVSGKGVVYHPMITFNSTKCPKIYVYIVSGDIVFPSELTSRQVKCNKTYAFTKDLTKDTMLTFAIHMIDLPEDGKLRVIIQDSYGIEKGDAVIYY